LLPTLFDSDTSLLFAVDCLLMLTILFQFRCFLLIDVFLPMVRFRCFRLFADTNADLILTIILFWCSSWQSVS
jgi:hypothetical protein